MANKSSPFIPADASPTDTIDFGDEVIPTNEKVKRVREVFDSVATSYDVMNDVMSLGIHRLWKARLISLISPHPSQHLVDIAGGTGDIAGRFLKKGGGSAVVADINTEMMAAGQHRSDLSSLVSLDWVHANAECLPFDDSTAEIAVIAFGLRNVTNRPAALREAYRILKPGGRFFCLEFSHIRAKPLAKAYDLWSSLLPGFGQVIAQDSASYHYLVESIRRFPNQEALAALFADAGFARIKYINLSHGIAAIHCGWKLD